MSNIKIGCSQVDVTPSQPVWLQGYAARMNKSNGVAEPLTLGVMAMQKDEVTVLFVCCDLVGIGYQKAGEIKEKLQDVTGVKQENIFISCSHTHFSPTVQASLSVMPEVGFAEPDPDFYQDFMTKLETCAKNSLDSLEVGCLETLKVSIPQVLYNRRTIKADGNVETNYLYPENQEELTFSKYDNELSVIRFTVDGKAKALMVNFGCHPVTGGLDAVNDFYKVSSDYPHYVRQYVSELYDCPVFFSLGAAGDTVPVRRYGNSRERIGRIIADSIYMNDARFTTENVDEISVKTIEFETETIAKVSPDCEEEFEKARQEAVKTVTEMKAVTDSKGNAAILESPYFVKGDQVAIFRRYPGNKWTVKASIIKMGNLQIITSPFETSSEICMEIKAKNPGAIVTTCTNGYEGYMFQEYEFERGGYETTSGANFKSDTADKLLDLILQNMG